MDFFILIPLETKIAILILVILPAIATILLRIVLHNKLQKINSLIYRLLSSHDAEGMQPQIVEKLRERYKKASRKLEHVNTAALIDSIYKEEKLRFLLFKIQLDKAESITKVLPNLLIAFGLIGTFWGITNNLNSISSAITISSDNTDAMVGSLQGLREPLQNMGTAFSASLFGILFGSILTIVNTLLNTGVAKYHLMAGLEDYLDNIYKPTVEGNTRLDTAIDRMIKQQQEFLVRFHENVGAILERSFGKAANQIAEECSRINQIAETVYTNFSNAAGTIATGANTFQKTANSFQSQNELFKESLSEFKSSVNVFHSSANQLKGNNIIQNIDRVLIDLNTNQQSFTYSTQILQNSLEGITSSNQTAAKLAEKIYQSWHTSISQIGTASETIDNGAIIFHRAATALEGQTQTLVSLVPELQIGINNFVSAADRTKENSIVKNLDALVVNLCDTQQSFTDSTKILKTGVEEIIENRQRSVQIAQQLSHDLEASTKAIQQGANSFLTAAEIIRDSKLSIELANTSSIHDRGEQKQLIEEIRNYFSQLNPGSEDSLQKILEILEKIDSGVELTHGKFPEFLNDYSKIAVSSGRSNSFRLIK
jgi:methyl-accepting chemotaxis protein